MDGPEIRHARADELDEDRRLSTEARERIGETVAPDSDDTNGGSLDTERHGEGLHPSPEVAGGRAGRRGEEP
jgi:hypothetical protein